LSSLNKNIFSLWFFKPMMLTRESLGLIFDELDGADRIVTVFTGLVPSHPIGSVDGQDFTNRPIFMIDLGCRDLWICNVAAREGSLECLRYARKSGCPWTVWTCMIAACVGSLECLEYAHENGCPWNEWTCNRAAEAGYLECLKYAREHGCPWDEWVCAWAAEAGSLECLKYAHGGRVSLE
jgi:hypothetical protein